MLPKKFRLTKRKHFAYLHRAGKHQRGAFVDLVYCYAGIKELKVGFSASKKVGNSVIRHLAVRKLRAGLRPYLKHLSPSVSYIFVAKENLHKQAVRDLSREMLTLIKKAGLLI
ncbi:MAG: ribonuclease P protein component [Christensenellaceae bacterium]|jgi:ribonuclease P protein component|nr:ribonuclease P protein component [Christensenellaceae bacterium]